MYGIGEYPPGFDPKVHGPYDPSRFYGKADTPISQVKLGELGSWISRRNKDPMSMARAIGRSYWRWSKKWVMVKRPTFAPVAQFLMLWSGIFYVTSYSSYIKYHRHTKYH